MACKIVMQMQKTLSFKNKKADILKSGLNEGGRRLIVPVISRTRRVRAGHVLRRCHRAKCVGAGRRRIRCGRIPILFVRSRVSSSRRWFLIVGRAGTVRTTAPIRATTIISTTTTTASTSSRSITISTIIIISTLLKWNKTINKCNYSKTNALNWHYVINIISFALAFLIQGHLFFFFFN